MSTPLCVSRLKIEQDSLMEHSSPSQLAVIVYAVSNGEVAARCRAAAAPGAGSDTALLSSAGDLPARRGQRQRALDFQAVAILASSSTAYIAGTDYSTDYNVGKLWSTTLSASDGAVTELASIAVSDDFVDLFALALSPDGSTAYVLGGEFYAGLELLWSVSLTNGDVTQLASLSFSPFGLTLSADGSIAYLIGYSEGWALYTITLSDGSSSSQLALPGIGEGYSLSDVALSSDGICCCLFQRAGGLRKERRAWHRRARALAVTAPPAADTTPP
jgi:hypothetical protein